MSDAAHTDAPTAWSLGQDVRVLDGGWEMASVVPDAYANPAEVERAGVTFEPAVVPATVAALNRKSTAEASRVDSQDHWYRVRLADYALEDARCVLCFDGLATLADVWLDGQHILASANMFIAHACDVTALMANPGEHVLYLRFRALWPVLKTRRPRGRWPTRLVSEKHLRFVRTSLLGYMPGWYPELPAVGPWRAVRLIVQRPVVFTRSTLRARLEGSDGVLSFDAECLLTQPDALARAALHLNGDREAELTITRLSEGRARVRGELRAPNVDAWWPHTHGDPVLHTAALSLHGARGVTSVALGQVGFRAIEQLRGADGEGFGLRINGADVFCRGACWTPLDVASVHSTPEPYRDALTQARDAGFNMLRISGVMAYEADAFYELCDELGILVWQDFMFANFDYPVDDAAFMASARAEACQLLDRLGSRCSLVVLCGGSEVAQQAAMMGVAAEQWSNALFDQVLPALCSERDVDALYVPSSPSGGALPFHVDRGVGHYYGVGAYLRPLDDVRIANVRFASECLAFANVPEPASLRRWFGEAVGATMTAAYRANIPRDPGATWDFADVTEHYISRLFGVDPHPLRDTDMDRYLAMSRAAVGETMTCVIQHLRRVDSGCNGALVWNLRDPQRTSGWGVVDSDGRPKAVYYYLTRACAPRALWFSDEGVNGVMLHAHNERPAAWRGRLELSLWREDGARVAYVEQGVEVAARDQTRWNVEALIGHFVDASYAYRFGPSGHRVIAARFIDDDTDLRPAGFEEPVVARAFHWVPGLRHNVLPELGITARLESSSDGVPILVVEASGVAQCVAIDAAGALPRDNYFHLIPHVPHRVPLMLDAATTRVVGTARALNCERVVHFDTESVG